MTLTVHSVTGPITIGTGQTGASRGALNVPGEGGQAFDSGPTIQAAIDLAKKSGGGVIQILPGDYFIHTPFKITVPVDIQLSPGVRIWPRATGPVGIAVVYAGGAGSRIIGGSIIVDRWIDDQELIRFQEVTDCFVDRVGVAMITRGGLVEAAVDTHSANPMRYFSFIGCPKKTVTNCTIVPSYGSVPIYAEYGQRLRLKDNDFGSFDGKEIVAIGEHVQKHVKKCVWLHHDRDAHIMGNTFNAMGDSTTFFPATKGPAVEHVIYYQNESGLGLALNEGGHLVIQNNDVEDVLCSTILGARGLRWATITGNRFDNTNDEINGALEGAMVFEAEDGGATGQISHDIAVSNNHSHNLVTGLGPNGSRDGHFLVARGVERLSVLSNHVKVFRGDYCIRLHPDDCPNFTGNGNTFESGLLSGAPQTSAAYYIEDGTSPAYSIRNETCWGMLSGVIDEGTVTGGTKDVANNANL